MTTRQFIYKSLKNTPNKVTYFGSVMVDTYGIVYSYGYHYPLVRIINGKAFVNDRGYSVTTAKHINWARAAAADIVGYGNVHYVELESGQFDLTGIRNDCNSHLKRIREEMDSKKRKDTKIYSWLERESNRVANTLIDLDSL